MEKGISKHWAPEAEERYKRLLAGCKTFAERHLTMLLRDIFKYDGRSKEGKIAMAQARLRIAVATNEDLKELAELQVRQAAERPGEIPGWHRASLVAEELGNLKNDRAKIREKGITKEGLRCR